MAERPWETMLREGLGDAAEELWDDTTSLVAEAVDYWPDVLDDDLRWKAAAALVLALIGDDDDLNGTLRIVLATIDSLAVSGRTTPSPAPEEST